MADKNKSNPNPKPIAPNPSPRGTPNREHKEFSLPPTLLDPPMPPVKPPKKEE